MKRQFVIECDTDYTILFVYEVDKSLTMSGKTKYTRPSVDNAVVSTFQGPKFYGQLNSILFTGRTVTEAPELVPEP